MKTVQLKIHEKVYDQVMALLKKFSKDEVELNVLGPDYEADYEYLSSELRKLDSGKAIFNTVEELEQILESLIKKHES